MRPRGDNAERHMAKELSWEEAIMLVLGPHTPFRLLQKVLRESRNHDPANTRCLE